MKNRNLPHKDDWKTPEWLYNRLNDRYKFDFDPCPFMHDMSWNGLEVDWGKSNFVNPPYSRRLKESFIKKAVAELRKGNRSVILLPVSTSTKIFHETILPNASEIYFIKGRVKFKGINTFGELVDNKAGMHDSMIVVFEPIKRYETQLKTLEL